MGLNITKLIFILFTVITAIISVMMHLIEDYLPIALKRAFRYGKYSEKEDHFIVKKLEVPKRWFAHFYLFAAPMSSFLLILCVSKSFYNCELPRGILLILDLQLGTHRQPLVSPGKTILAIVLLTIQCWKRCYESHFVSVYSNTKMNIIHYIVGFIHYIEALTCIVGESHGFIKGFEGSFRWNQLTYVDLICATTFLWASYEQLKSNIILANLRKNEKGRVITESYKIPHGGLFDYISGPLQFTEIIMYLMMTVILWESSLYRFVFIWVLVNQTETALSSHQWYKKTFKNYPQTRKIYIPFLI